ncbi:hypothetical protein yaldo0001_9250 [Yersinia aldovae ATCC 35236]|nr:hypothetical protein yaldo0001_9250 [Yersinia aldovae ATCC 35236]
MVVSHSIDVLGNPNIVISGTSVTLLVNCSLLNDYPAARLRKH